METLLTQPALSQFLNRYPSEQRLSCLMAASVIGVNSLKGESFSLDQLWEIANSFSEQSVPIWQLHQKLSELQSTVSRLQAKNQETPRFTQGRQTMSSKKSCQNSSSRLQSSIPRSSSACAKHQKPYKEEASKHAPRVRQPNGNAEGIGVNRSSYFSSKLKSELKGSALAERAQSLSQTNEDSEVLHFADKFLADPLLTRLLNPERGKELGSFRHQLEMADATNTRARPSLKKL